MGDLPNDQRPPSAREQAVRHWYARKRALRRWFAEDGDATLRLHYDDLAASSVVFDVGAYQGQWTLALFGKYAPRMFLFEPVPDHYARLEALFAGNPNIRVFPFGLGKSSGAQTFAVQGDASKAFEAAADHEAGQTITARVESIVDFIRGQGFTAIDLMKINIEGAEYELLEALLDAGLAGTVKHFQIQFHDFVPDAAARRAALQARLALTHALQWDYYFVWEGWRRNK